MEEAKLKDKEEKEQKIVDEELDIKLKEKETEIKNRKNALLKRLEDNIDGGNKDISKQEQEK